MSEILKITINNEVISENYSSDTYIKVFNYLYENGLITSNISNDFPNLVRNNKNDWTGEHFKDAFLINNSNNLYPSTHSSTSVKKDQIEKVFAKYNITGKVEIINTNSKSTSSKPSQTSSNKSVRNKLEQAICVIGESGVGKTYRINETLKYERHKTLFIIVDNMWQHILFDYSPIDRKYNLTKVGEFIKNAFYDQENNYTIVIDECHKNLEIINDVLLQAISTKRNDGVRFLALNSLVDKLFDFLPENNGNRILPNNLGFLFISSKSDIIEGNDDLKNRIEIIELTESDQSDNVYTIDYLLSKIKKKDQSEYTN